MCTFDHHLHTNVRKRTRWIRPKGLMFVAYAIVSKPTASVLVSRPSRSKRWHRFTLPIDLFLRVSRTTMRSFKILHASLFDATIEHEHRSQISTTLDEIRFHNNKYGERMASHSLLSYLVQKSLNKARTTTCMN